MRLRRLPIGFLIAILFCGANLISYYRMPEYSTMDDGFVAFGWPFTVYEYGGFWTHSVIVWTGLVGNVFVALSAHRIVRRMLQNIPRTKWKDRRLMTAGRNLETR